MAWRAERQPGSPDEYVFPTASGRARDKENISRRVLGPTIKRANEPGAERDLPPLPAVTAHALRRTYISLMIEAGAPLPYVMSQVGHADSRTTLEVSAQVTGDPAGLGDAETASSGDLDGPRGPRSGPRR